MNQLLSDDAERARDQAKMSTVIAFVAMLYLPITAVAVRGLPDSNLGLSADASHQDNFRYAGFRFPRRLERDWGRFRSTASPIFILLGLPNCVCCLYRIHSVRLVALRKRYEQSAQPEKSFEAHAASTCDHGRGWNNS